MGPSRGLFDFSGWAEVLAWVGRKTRVLDAPDFLMGETLLQQPWLLGCSEPLRLRAHGEATLYVAAGGQRGERGGGRRWECALRGASRVSVAHSALRAHRERVGRCWAQVAVRRSAQAASGAVRAFLRATRFHAKP